MNHSRTFLFCILAILIVYVCGLPIDIMEVDAAQYATISREMFYNHSYLEVYCRGYDYLDKPPFLFWLNQVFFSVFGVHGWSFKLGSLVFLLIGIYSTFKLGELIYSKQAGIFSALILASTQAWFLISHDVKTDAILASAVVFTVWQWKLFTLRKKWGNLVLTSIGIGIAMLTKGPIGLMIPVIIMGSDLLVHKNWKMIFQWKYLVGLIIIALALAPMLYGLYHQFDLHPGKMAAGNQPVDSGIKFYFWTQSFGRLTGESTWKNNSSYFYFLPEILWSFLPWSIFIIQAVFIACKESVKKHIIPLSGFFIPLLALSLSHYKLSHYIYVCFPFIALIVGNYFSGKKPGGVSTVLMYLEHILLFAGMLFLGYCFHISWGITLGVAAVVLFVYITVLRKANIRPLFLGITVAAGLNLFLHLFIYPALLKYQSSSTAAKLYAQLDPLHSIPLYEVDNWSFALEPALNMHVDNVGNIEDLKPRLLTDTCWIFTSSQTYDQIEKAGFKILETHRIDHYPVSRISPGFLWPGTRKKFISERYLVKVYLSSRWAR